MALSCHMTCVSSLQTKIINLSYCENSDCRYGESWQKAEVLYDSETDKFKPLDIVLDMRVKNISISENKLIIEATED